MPAPMDAAGATDTSTTTNNNVGEREHTQPQRHCFGAVLENRAKEVGLAVLDAEAVRLYLVQYIEAGRSYTTTNAYLNFFAPGEVLVVASSHYVFAPSSVNQLTKGNHMQIPLPRRDFDDTRGLETALSLATEDGKLSLKHVQESHYLALAATGALLKYIAEARQMMIANTSLSIETSINLQMNVLIDAQTVEALELVDSNTPRLAGRKTCLLAVLDRTKTKSGRRLLRTNILQPLRDRESLELRLDSVQELLEKPDVQTDLENYLASFPADLDKMCCNLAIRHFKKGSNSLIKIDSMVQSIVLLRNLLRLLPGVGHCINASSSELLTVISNNFSALIFADLLQKIEQVIDDQTQPSKTPFINKIQQCFAVKPDVDSFLDLARISFCRLTEDVHELVERYKNETGWNNMKMSYTAKKGFFLSVYLPDNLDETIACRELDEILPESFSILERHANRFHCTTDELNAYNARLSDAAEDCMLQTEQVLNTLTNEIMASLPLLQKLVDNIALLDLLCSFAKVISSSNEQLVRPEFSIHNSAPLVISNGRHPMIELIPDLKYCPNDTYVSKSCPMHIITGPNMSGKSTYLKQVALIIIMAQIGCFVPASHMYLRPVDGLFSRIGSTDCVEANCSSFMMEMHDLAHIAEKASSSSLVIMDELGRSTSTVDGAGIAWAACEYLMSKRIYTLFATHLPELEKLPLHYPMCRLWHMEVEITRDNMKFLWALKTSSMENRTHYGVLLAKQVGFPEEVVQEALRVAQLMDKNAKERHHIELEQSAKAQRGTDILSVVHRLACLARQREEGLSDELLRTQLAALQNEAEGLEAAT